MTPERETPAPQRRQAEGETGAMASERSIPGWARRRTPPTLLRHAGQYFTPEALTAHLAAQAAEARGRPLAAETAFYARTEALRAAGGDVVPPASGLTSPPADRAAKPPEAGEPPLPCRFIESTASNPPRAGTPAGLTPGQKKTAAALSWNVAHLVEKFGLERVGFLTLTFADHVTDPREAQRRFHSLKTNILRKRYAEHIRVVERQKSGRIHYHLLVVCADDIRTGADFDAFALRDYKSANNHLRREWAFWRKTAPLYNFGRTELMPVRSNSQAMGAYVGKYIAKHIGQREERDKGIRLVEYTRGARMASTRFTSTGSGSTLWRQKLQTFVHLTRASHPGEPVTGLASLRRIYGPRWSFHWRDFILQLTPSPLDCPF